MPCPSRWPGEQGARHQEFAPELLEPLQLLGRLAQTALGSPSPAVAGGAVGTNLRRLQGQMLSYTLGRVLALQVKQNWRNAVISRAISLPFCFVGWGWKQWQQKCSEACNSCQNTHLRIPLPLSFTLTVTHRTLLTDVVSLDGFSASRQ